MALHLIKYFTTDALPKNLRTLRLGVNYNKRYTQNVLPKNLTKLIFERNSIYNHNFTQDILPKNLLELQLGRKYCHSLYLAYFRKK